MTPDEFEQNVATPLWKRIDKFDEHFPSGGMSRDLPAYEKIYRKFLETALGDLKKIRMKKSPRLLRTLVLAIFAFEFGCRPEDLRNTIRLEHITLRATLDGRKFYFLKYQPSKTNKSPTSMYATTALPPWFNDAFDLYFDEVRKTRPDEPLFPTPHMSTRISQLSFRYLGQKFSANSYRKMIASFFSRNSIPGLYRMTGRVADKRLELITEIEMRHYAECATNEEMLLEIRFGKDVQKILGIEDLVKTLTKNEV